MEFGEAGVKYKFAQAFRPKTPRARTSKPTRMTAAPTRVVAPPGKFPMVAVGLRPENFQIKIPNRICAARNDTPASTIVSAICSSIRAPCVEMSCGGTQVCRMMGTAEAIAINTSVTANSLAMICRLEAAWEIRQLVAGRPLRSIGSGQIVSVVLLRLKRETGSPRLSGCHRHFLCLCAVRLLPGCYRVTARRNIFHSERTAVITHCVRSLHHRHVAMHPGMNVALYIYGDFLRLPNRVDGRSAGRLRLVPPDISASRLGEGMDIVCGWIAIGDLHMLIHIHRCYMRRIHAPLLVVGNRL